MVSRLRFAITIPQNLTLKTGLITCLALGLVLSGCGGSSNSSGITPLSTSKMLLTTIGSTADSIGSIGSDGTARTAIFASGTDEPALSQDRTKVAFVETISGKGQVFVANIDGTGVTQLSNGAFKDGKPTFSADGTKIIFLRDIDGAGDSQIFTIPVSGGSVTQLTSPANNQTLPHNFDPVFSPDGSRIAFWQSTLGGSGSIMVANADGTNQVAITPVGGTSPAWSPDGTKIAYQFAGAIMVMNADGSNKITVSTGTSNSQPTWSPDGSQIAFTTARSADAFTLQIYKVPAAGGTETPITSDQANPGLFARWSRN